MRNYFSASFIKKYSIILIMAFACGFLAFVFIVYQNFLEVGELTLSIVQIAENKNVNYKLNFDGYYLVETQRVFGRRLGNWLSDFSWLDAELIKENDSGKPFKNIIKKVQKLNDYDYLIILKGSNRADIEKFNDFFFDVLKKRVEVLSLSSQEKAVFSILRSPLYFNNKKNSIFLITLYGFFGGAVIGWLITKMRNEICFY